MPLAVAVLANMLSHERAGVDRIADAVVLAVATDQIRGRPVTGLPVTDADGPIGLETHPAASWSGTGRR